MFNLNLLTWKRQTGIRYGVDITTGAGGDVCLVEAGTREAALEAAFDRVLEIWETLPANLLVELIAEDVRMPSGEVLQ